VGYPNEFPLEWNENVSNFDGEYSQAIINIVSLLKYVSKLNVMHEDVLIKIFLVSLEGDQKIWVKNCSDPRTISSFPCFVKLLFKH
jgi:hypothetical protein